jgi:hypothetical protein
VVQVVNSNRAWWLATSLLCNHFIQVPFHPECYASTTAHHRSTKHTEPIMIDRILQVFCSGSSCCSVHCQVYRLAHADVSLRIHSPHTAEWPFDNGHHRLSHPRDSYSFPSPTFSTITTCGRNEGYVQICQVYPSLKSVQHNIWIASVKLTLQ